jgi:uncharacterized membrane protein
MTIATSRALRHKLLSLALASAAALIGFVIAPEAMQGLVRLVAAWDAGAVTLLLFTWWRIVRADAPETRTWAAAEDPGQIAAFAIDMLGSAASFAAAVLLLGQEQMPSTGEAIWLVVVAVVSAWALMHTGFTVRYAHLYYRDDGDIGGLDFPGREEPDYLDFAYFAFVIGMTFQTADVSISSRMIRRLALIHGVLAFGFNTLILALAVNLIFGRLVGAPA